MTKILVTGASGFIGQHLVRRLKKEGHSVIELSSKDGDISDPQAWVSHPPAEIVIHLAAATFVPASWKDPSFFMQTNFMGTLEVLKYCSRHKSKLIFLSSYLYGNPDELPIAETAELRVNNPYALSKKLAEDLCQFYSVNYDVDVLIFRPFNIYGPGQSGNFLIPSIIDQIIKGDKIYIKDLTPRRDYIYVYDLVDAIVKGLSKEFKFSVYNIGTGVSFSVSELIGIIQKIMGADLEVVSSNEVRAAEIMDTIANIARAEHELGWVPAWNLETGIHDMVEQVKGRTS